MNILIVNDDGILAPGILALTEAAAQRGHKITVYAPDEQRSAASHCITLTAPLRCKKMESYPGGATAYAVNGSPADCARLGIFREREHAPIDFVLSGINKGPNRGTATLYSGTVGAAMEASLCGIGALAVSLCSHEDRDYEIAAQLGVRVMEWAVDFPLPLGMIYSLNVPKTDVIPEVRPASLSREYIFDPIYEKHEDGSYTFVTGKDLYPYEPDSDTALTNAGYSSLSVLTWNLLHALPDITGLNKEN